VSETATDSFKQDLLSLLPLFCSNVGDVDHLPLRRNQLEDITASVEDA